MNQPSKLVLVLIITVLVVIAALLVRIDSQLRRQPELQPITPAAVTTSAPAPAPAPAPVQAVVEKPQVGSKDAQILLAALGVLERRSNDSNARMIVLRSLRRIDPEAFFRELLRLVAAGNPNDLRYALQEDGSEGTLDRGFLPVIKAIIDRSLQGENSGQDMSRLVMQLQRIDPELAAPYVDEVVRRMLERSEVRFDGDQVTQRFAASSGVAMAHALVMRGMRTNEYGGNGREQVYLQLADIYQGVRPFPVLNSEKRDQKLADEDKKHIQENELWIIANRNLLVLDRTSKRMVLAKDAAEADQLRASQPVWKAPVPVEEAKPATF